MIPENTGTDGNSDKIDWAKPALCARPKSQQLNYGKSAYAINDPGLYLDTIPYTIVHERVTPQV